MKHCVFLVCSSSGLLALTLCQMNVVLPNCTNNFLDIQENKNNTVLCEGFNPQATVVWSIYPYLQVKMLVATCDPSNCTVHQPDHFAVQRSSSHSLLFYQQYDRQFDGLATVICESQLGDERRTKTCVLNVINRATVSDCRVEMDTHSLSVTGSCRFKQAASFGKGFTCIWYRKRDNEETRPFTGTITIASMEDHLGSGVCNCSWSNLPTDQAASYTYTIDFYPGPGNITVHFGTTEPTTHETASSTIGEPASSTIGETQPVTSLEPPSSTVLNNSTLQTGNEQKSLHVAAIVGGCVGVVVVIVVAVVIVVIVVKRRDATYAKPRRRQTPEHVYDGLHTTTTTTSTTANTTSASDFAETTISDQHNLALDDTQKQGVKPNHARHNPVYVNEEQRQPEGVTGAVYYNQVTQGYTGVTQNPTYVNDSGKAAHEYSNGDRDSNPYYSEIKD